MKIWQHYFIIHILMTFYLEINTAQILDWTHFSEDTSKSNGLINHNNVNRDIFPVYKPIRSNHNKQLCFCPKTDSNPDEVLYNNVRKQTMKRDLYNDAKQFFHSGAPSIEAGQVNFQSIVKESSNEGNNSSCDSNSSQDEHQPFKSVQVRRSKTCLRPHYVYEDCVVACRDACTIVRMKYGIERKLYKRLRTECKNSCGKMYKKPADC